MGVPKSVWATTICQLHKQWDVVLYTDGFTCALNRGEEVDCI